MHVISLTGSACSPAERMSKHRRRPLPQRSNFAIDLINIDHVDLDEESLGSASDEGGYALVVEKKAV